MCVIAGTQGTEGNLLVTGVLQHGSCRLLQFFYITFTERSVDHTSLAETTATDTSTLDFQSDTILCSFNKRNNRFFNRAISFIHIYDQLLLDFLGNSRTIWCKGCNCTVFFVCDIIKCRNINSRNLSCLQKELLPAASGFLIGLVCIKKRIIHSFSFANIKQVKKGC